MDVEDRLFAGVPKSPYRPAGARRRCGGAVRLVCVILLGAGTLALCGCEEPKPKTRFIPPGKGPSIPLGQPPGPGIEVRDEPPKPQQATADLFFPRHVGDTWEMIERAGGKSTRVVMRSLGERTVGGVPIFFIEMQRDGVAVQEEGYTVDEQGVHRVAAGPKGEYQIQPPMTMLKLPFATGSEWAWEGVMLTAGGATSASAKFRLDGPELIKTPAGSFQAYRLEQVFTAKLPEGDAVVKNTQWFAPHTGLVRVVYGEGADRVVGELIAFRPGTTKPPPGNAPPAGNTPPARSEP